MKPQSRFRTRTWILIVVALTLGVLYVGSYYRLSRRGMREARDYGLAGFLYVPCEEAAETESLLRHRRLAAFYTPANWIDRQLFGGENLAVCVIWRIGG